MRVDKPRYYRVRRNGRAFFELGSRALAVGMKPSVPLGPDTDDARLAGWRLYHEWKIASGRAEPTAKETKYPRGALGHFFSQLRLTKAWAKKAVTTRDEWEDCWNYISPAFGARRINSISPAEVAEFQDTIEEAHGEYVRWRVIKILRALFNAAVHHHVIPATPAKAVTNPQPKGRREIWRAAEIAKLIDAADKIGKPAMALAIRIAWETALAPVDVRKLSPAMLRSDASGAWFETQRSKTSAVVVSAISDGLKGEIAAYVQTLGVAVLPDQPFLRTSRDAHEYRKARFIEDFAQARAAAFGEEEKRRFQDIRRSANIEAELGDATPEERAAMLANRLDKDAALDAVYTPATVERSRKMADKRLIGRRLLAVQSVNTSGESRN